MPLANRMRMAAAAGVGGGGWWELAGPSLTPYAAYQAVNVASEADSWVDLTGNGNDLTKVGTIAWTTAGGWQFTAANSARLDTGLKIQSSLDVGRTESMFVRFDGVPTGFFTVCGADQYAFTTVRANVSYTYLSNHSSSYSDIAVIGVGGDRVAGFAGGDGYVNGVFYETMDDTVAGSLTSRNCQIGCMGYRNAYIEYLTGYVKAFVWYEETLSTDQVTELSANMAAL